MNNVGASSARPYFEEITINYKGGKVMKQYECTICGYVYDESVEGVKFEDLPEDWVCPLCGVGKDMFKEVE